MVGTGPQLQHRSPPSCCASPTQFEAESERGGGARCVVTYKRQSPTFNSIILMLDVRGYTNLIPTLFPVRCTRCRYTESLPSARHTLKPNANPYLATLMSTLEHIQKLHCEAIVTTVMHWFRWSIACCVVVCVSGASQTFFKCSHGSIGGPQTPCRDPNS